MTPQYVLALEAGFLELAVGVAGEHKAAFWLLVDEPPPNAARCEIPREAVITIIKAVVLNL